MARPQNCGKCNKPKRPKGNKFKNLPNYCECGRPTIMDKNMLQKLEDAFINGFPDREACVYAGISPQTLYNYQKENPEFVERKEALKLYPNIKARRTINKALDNTPDAWKWLEKKDPEFKPTSKIEHAGSVEVTDITDKMGKEEKEALELFRRARRKRIEEESDNLE